MLKVSLLDLPNLIERSQEP